MKNIWIYLVLFGFFAPTLAALSTEQYVQQCCAIAEIEKSKDCLNFEENHPEKVPRVICLNARLKKLKAGLEQLKATQADRQNRQQIDLKFSY